MSMYFYLYTEQSKSVFEKTNPHKIDPVKKPRPQKAQPSKASINPLENIMQAQEKLLDNPKHHKGMMVSHLLINAWTGLHKPQLNLSQLKLNCHVNLLEMYMKLIYT